MSSSLLQVWERAVEIWVSGGWAMIAIAIVGLFLFAVGVHVQLRLRRTGFRSVPEATWRRWIDRPDERRGRIGKLIEAAWSRPTLEETEQMFEQLRTTEAAPFERDLRVMKTCVSAAPLVGLLGTVTGMLSTFDALASGSGGEKTMALVAKGISEALITTETGLVVALPGLFLQFYLTNQFERYRAFLAHVENVCTQSVYRRFRHLRASA